MSTKIYYAWRSTRPVKGLATLREESAKIRALLQPQSEREYYQSMAEYLCWHLDSQAVGLGTKPKRSGYEYLRGLDDKVREHQRKGEYSLPGLDTEISWVFLFPSDDHVLLLVYGPRRDCYKSVIAQLPFWQEYGYWDNSDQLEGVSDREWAKRRSDWDEVYSDNTTPAQNGFVVELWGKYNAPSYLQWEKVLRHQPSRRKRLDQIVLHLVRESFKKEGSPGKFEDWLDESRRSQHRVVAEEQLSRRITKNELLATPAKPPC